VELINTCEARHNGRRFCKTAGSEHYRQGAIEPLDLIIALGLAEDHCLASIIKYAARFKVTGDLEDLKKIADYAHILCGVKLAEKKSCVGSLDNPDDVRSTIKLEGEKNNDER
jgi:hypothetical protein